MSKLGIIGMATLAIAVGALLLGLVGMAAFGIWNAQQRSDITGCTVEHKEAVPKGDSGNQYRIYTDQCGVLAVQDSIFAGRWNSADVYHDLRVDGRYDFHVQGGRYPFFSMFPNVLEAEPSW